MKENERESSLIEDSKILELIQPSNFDIKNFTSQFTDKSKQVLDQLLLLQDNDAPLKKGGEDIAFRCDLLILKNKQKYSNYANTLLDVISGMISSYPSNDIYSLTVTDLQKKLSNYSRQYSYELIRKAIKELQEKSFCFEYESNGVVKTIAIPWMDILTIENDNKNENISICFKPSNFYKMLTVASTIVHGAHYNILVSSQIQSNYVRNLFYILDSKKRYRSYIDATEGIFEMSIVDLMDILGCKPSMTTSILKRDVLEKAKEIINSIDICDFTFDWEYKKGLDPVTGRKVITHVIFEIHVKKGVNTSNLLFLDSQSDVLSSKELKKVPNYSVISTLLSENNISKKDQSKIISHYVKYNRTLNYLIDAISLVNNAENLKSKTAYLIWAMCNDITKKENRGVNINVVNYSNSSETYANKDNDELEEMLGIM